MCDSPTSRLAKNLLVIIFFSFVGLETTKAETGTRPNADQGPTIIKVTAILGNLDKVDTANQSFAANVYFIAEWKDERLRHNEPEEKIVPRDSIWCPVLQVVNRQRAHDTMSRDFAYVSPEGVVRIKQRTWGNFSQPLNLRNFPFDQQTLQIQLVAVDVSPEHIQLVQNSDRNSAVNLTSSVPDWKITDWNTASSTYSLPGLNTTPPLFTLTVHIQRYTGYHVVKVILPLLMIVAMSYMVFWLNPKNSGPQISVAVTTMLTLIAYRFAVGASLPQIPYLTRMDWFILGASILVFISLIEVVVTTSLVERGKEASALRLDRIMRYASPTAFLLVALKALLW